jgi:glycosyltransferase involved in cell wall biosynthesis
MKHLSKSHSLRLVCLKPEKGFLHSPEFIDQLEFVCHRKVSRSVMWLRYLRHMLAGVPSIVSANTSLAMRRKVKALIEGGNIDATLLFEMSAIQYCPPSCYRKLIVNIEDPESIKLGRMTRLSVWSLWQTAKLFVLAGLAAHYEKTMLPRIAKVLLLSEADKQDMCEKVGYENLACVTYGVDQRGQQEPVGYEQREKAVVFSGNMYHPPNVDGALFLLTDIFPLILRAYPSAILWIVGADPDDRIVQAARKLRERVVITGRVEDVALYIRRATVSVCPVRLKIGVQTKVLEALSWGTPVVTTSAGNSGVGGVPGRHLWVEDEPGQFASKVVALLKGCEWSELSQEGRRFVAERFTWERSVRQLERHLESLSTG